MEDSAPDGRDLLLVAFLDDLEDKVRFLCTLYDQGRRDEAMMLCCLYLDGLGCRLATSHAGSAQGFSELLIQQGGETALALILPHRLVDKLPWKSHPADFRPTIEPALRALPDHELLTDAELIVALHPPAEHAKRLQGEVWRGSVANLAYERIRSLAVHDLSSTGGLDFGDFTHHGARLPAVDFTMLHRALTRVVVRVRSDALSATSTFYSGAG